MLGPSRRSSLHVALIAASLLLIAVLDFLLPGNYLTASLFAFPMLLAAIVFTPRGVAFTAIIAFTLVGIAAIVRQPPMVVSVLGLFGIAAIGGLAVLLARQRQAVLQRSTEREEARRQLTEILESIGDGFFALDESARFTYVNQHAERFLGRDRAALLGARAWGQFPVETREAFERAVTQAAATNEAVHVETYDPRFDTWYEVHVYPSAEAGLSVYFRDFTSRKSAEEGRREAEATYRSLVEQIPAVTYRVENRLGDESGETGGAYISPQLETMLGFPVNEWVKEPKNWVDHLHPEDRARVLEANARANETGQPLRVEYRMISADGSPIWVRDEASIVTPEVGGHRTWQGVIFDVTPEKEAEAARAESARKFAFLAETSRVLTAAQLDYEVTLKQIADLTVPDLADWAIIYVFDERHGSGSATACAVPEDAPLTSWLTANPISMLARPDIRDMLESGRALHLPTFEEVDALGEMLSEEEANLFHAMHCGSAVLMPVRARGNLLGALLLARHVTTQAYAPDDLSFIEEVVHRFALVLDNARLYQEARSALAAREEFLSVAAHELRTPLTGIKGYVQLLDRRLNRSPQSIEAVRATLDSLRPQLARFERIVEDLLEVTRAERSELSIQREPCDLAQIAANVFDGILNSEEHDPEQPMYLTVPETLPGYWDPTRIAQVVENLLSNALRYSLGKGDVRLRVAREGDVAVISAHDQGIGLSPEDQQRVFEPFFRGDVLAGQIAGSGLGLAIAKRIVEQHGGTIEVESVLDQGSTFTVRLPIDQAPLPSMRAEETVER